MHDNVDPPFCSFTSSETNLYRERATALEQQLKEAEGKLEPLQRRVHELEADISNMGKFNTCNSCTNTTTWLLLTVDSEYLMMVGGGGDGIRNW